jgi:hypothetical protein
MYRTRSSGALVVTDVLSDFSYYYCSDNAFKVRQTYGFVPVANGSLSTITDETGPLLFHDGLKPIRNVRHERMTVNNPVFPAQSDNSGVEYWSTPNYVWGPWQYSTDWTIHTPTQSELDAINAEAFDKMKPSLEGDLSMTNFLLEIGDIKSTLSFAKKGLSLLQRVAAGNLSWQFAVRPTLRDLSDLYDSMLNLNEKIENFRKKGRMLQRRHFRKVFLDSPKNVITESLAENVKCRITSEEKVVCHFTMFYRYAVPDISVPSNYLNAVRDILGLKLDVSKIWNAIPFSFVLDWFLKIGKWLEQFDSDLTDIRLEVVGYCYSYKCTKSEKKELALWNKCTRTFSEYRIYSEKEQRRYVRGNCLPNSGTYFATKSTFGLNQLGLSASLLVMNRR